MSDWSGQWKSTDRVMEKYWPCDTCYKIGTLVAVSHSLVIERQVNVMTNPSPEESPTRYMLPDQDEGKGLVNYSLNLHSPAKYPIVTKKRKKPDKKKNHLQEVEWRRVSTQNHRIRLETKIAKTKTTPPSQSKNLDPQTHTHRWSHTQNVTKRK